jgi:hypothetical protein
MEGGDDCIQDWLIRLCMPLSELPVMIEDVRGRLRRGSYAEIAITHSFQDIPSGPTDKAIPLGKLTRRGDKRLHLEPLPWSAADLTNRGPQTTNVLTCRPA